MNNLFAFLIMRFQHHYYYLDIACIFLLSLILFTWGLSTQEVIGFDSRFYLFAKEMWENGISWFPTTYHEPYPDYLASSTILIYLIAHLFGGMNKFVAIFPSAFAASITLTFVYLIGALQNRRFGLHAVLLMTLTISFFQNARSISLDLFITMITTICFYILYSADQKQSYKQVCFIYILLFIGFAIRGPIGLVIPTGVVCTYYLSNLNVKQCLTTGCFSLLLLLIATCCLLFVAYQSGGESFLKDVWRMQVLGRIDNHFFPRYFYFTNSFKNYALSFPLAFFVMMGAFYYSLIRRYRSTEMDLLWKLIGWVAVILIGMSIPGDKKTRYILPVAPAISLLAAYLFNASLPQAYFVWLRRIVLCFLFLLPTIILCFLFFLNAYAYEHQLNFNIGYFYIALFLCLMQLLNILIFYPSKFFLIHRDTIFLSVASLSFVFCYLNMIEPVELYIDGSRNFVEQIEKRRLHDGAPLIFYKEKPDNLPIKYLINMQAYNAKPLFMSHSKDLLNMAQSAYFVTSSQYFSEMSQEMKNKFKIIARNKLGHVPVVVFTQKGSS